MLDWSQHQWGCFCFIRDSFWHFHRVSKGGRIIFLCTDYYTSYVVSAEVLFSGMAQHQQAHSSFCAWPPLLPTTVSLLLSFCMSALPQQSGAWERGSQPKNLSHNLHPMKEWVYEDTHVCNNTIFFLNIKYFCPKKLHFRKIAVLRVLWYHSKQGALHPTKV